MVYDFSQITPSTNLTWAPCWDIFTCARLVVPLDYSNVSLGNTPIAFMKYPAENETASTPNILLNQGGPGGSGVSFLMQAPATLQSLLGPQYNLIGFDPRGVNNSGPFVDCFPGRPDARAAWQNIFLPDVSDASSTSLSTQYYSSGIFGEWCNTHLVQNTSAFTSQYITTPLVARDMLAFAQAAKPPAGSPSSSSPTPDDGTAVLNDGDVWYYGISYGTVLGATFASLFPDHVGRVILDGVVDAEDYYTNGWRSNLFDADQAIVGGGGFIADCYRAGPGNCSFWGPSERNMTDRLRDVVQGLRQHPVPIPDPPSLGTYSMLKTLLLQATYAPLIQFPALAEVLTLLESGNRNATALLAAVSFLATDDAAVLIRCVDAAGRDNNNNNNQLDTYRQFEDYVATLESQSRWVGDTWATNAIAVACRGLEPDVPPSILFPGPLPPSSNNTKNPVLFASNTIDPVAPIRGAHKMSRGFANSAVLVQEGVGHTVLVNSGSDCYWEHVGHYLATGSVPPANTTCAAQFVPFRDVGLYTGPV
ncbi:Alpha/Beta hydrolase protein [Diplogelasinospora grovesii]|uniref:Alpha/Beta hydrolase protein n=1 Tax=Diplogelasinospora grovesii TaxID=303347 RepID=A0AAN6N2V6_9PEZI|nr:Alpha/Beta hydrolase protein [Diplogelasinospora grovesii]